MARPTLQLSGQQDKRRRVDTIASLKRTLTIKSSRYELEIIGLKNQLEIERTYNKKLDTDIRELRVKIDDCDTAIKNDLRKKDNEARESQARMIGLVDYLISLNG